MLDIGSSSLACSAAEHRDRHDREADATETAKLEKAVEEVQGFPFAVVVG